MVIRNKTAKSASTVNRHVKPRRVTQQRKMYASGNSNCFSEIGPLNELNYASSPESEPPSKKRCGLIHITAIPEEHSQISNSYEQLQKCSTSTDITISAEAVPAELPCCTDTIAKVPANGLRLKEESNPGVLEITALPTEEVLGSVTTFYPTGHPENGHTLRTSARVKHKMRMETIHNTPQPIERKEQPKQTNPTLAKTPNQQKQMRVVWSNHDKNLFFEALNEYGKNFEAILTYLNTKKRRKDNACEQQVFKTKDVRNLYYQFNQKISKYLHFSEEVKKEAQELYSLINYGEMRKKVPFQNKKYFHKLKDLVYKGFTMVREKGKTIRIKTPSCRALRKLNQLEEWQEEIKLPPRVDVLLRPANMDAWGRVQSLAQNPRVRITLTIQKRVSSLLLLLQQKWRPNELRLVERVEKMKRVAATVTSKLMRQRIQNEIQFCLQTTPSAVPPPSLSATVEDNESAAVANMLLHVVPSQSAVIHRPLISLSEFQSNTSICLNSYEQRIGVKVRGETLAATEKPGNGPCKESKKSKLSHEATHDTMKDEKQPVELLTKSTIDELLKSPNASNESIELKDMDIFEMELLNGHVGSNGDDCDIFEAIVTDGACTTSSINGTATEHAYATINTSASATVTDTDMAVADQKNNSSDEHSAGEEATMRDNCTLTTTNEITTCVTTTTTTTSVVRKREKCTRRKGSDSSKTPTSAGVFQHFRPLVSVEEMQRVRDGWTLSNVNDLTVGDLYIMFGEDMKLHLEYDWVWEDAQNVPSVDVVVYPAANDEQPPSTATPPNMEGEKQHRAYSSLFMIDHLGADDATCLRTASKQGCNEISRRLKQLLLFVNIGRNGKKKCICANTIERKPKRNDNDINRSSGQDESQLFKQPMLPARNSTNYLIPEMMHMPPQRYKQSRWWRTRINRQQVLPLPRSSYPSTGTASSTVLAKNTVPLGEITPRTSIPHNIPASISYGEHSRSVPVCTTPWLQPTETNDIINHALHYDEENANDIGANDKFILAKECNVGSYNQTNPLSSNALSVGFCAQHPQSENSSGSDQSTMIATKSTTTVTKVPTSTSIAALPQDDNSCLSLFDLSLPSTSSSLMANIFSTSTNEPIVDSSLLSQGGVSGMLPNSPVDAKLLDQYPLNDISLSSFFGQLDAVYQNDGEVLHPSVRQPDGIDLDLSVMSENSVDYIARFQNIASELRAQRNP